MSTVPPEVEALVRKAHRIEHEQNACFHEWEWVGGKMTLKDNFTDYRDIDPATGRAGKNYMVYERKSPGHWHCQICNLRTSKEPGPLAQYAAQPRGDGTGGLER